MGRATTGCAGARSPLVSSSCGRTPRSVSWAGSKQQMFWRLWRRKEKTGRPRRVRTNPQRAASSGYKISFLLLFPFSSLACLSHTSVTTESAFKAPILAKFSKESSCYYSSARLWDDGVIKPRDTRQVLGLGLAVAVKEQAERTQFGVFRM